MAFYPNSGRPAALSSGVTAAHRIYVGPPRPCATGIHARVMHFPKVHPPAGAHEPGQRRPGQRRVTGRSTADRINQDEQAHLDEGMHSNWLNMVLRRCAVGAVGLILSTPVRAESVEGLWAVIPDAGTAVKLAMIGLHDGDDEPRLFRISCDKWGAVDLVFFGEAQLVEDVGYDLVLRINGRAETFSGKVERSDLGTVLYWSATVGLTHPLFDRLAQARRLDLSINGLNWRLPIDQLSWSLGPFREWCQDLAATAPRR